MTSLLAAILLASSVPVPVGSTPAAAPVASDTCSADVALNQCSLPPPPPPPLPTGWWLTVLPGDTLSELVASTGADFNATVQTNVLGNPDWIDVGRRLLLVGGHEPAAPPVAAAPAPSPTLGGAPAPTPGPRPQVAAVGNHFSFGYCTWYVANRRPIPWNGDAGQWGPNARAMGFPEGMLPRAGAIMVTWEGPIGHVAYVESVNADGSWVVSEMNYNAWNVIDYRTVRPGTIPLETFIY